MSRAQDFTRQLTDQQLASLNSLNQQFLGQQQQIGNLLLPQFQQIEMVGFSRLRSEQ